MVVKEQKYCETNTASLKKTLVGTKGNSTHEPPTPYTSTDVDAAVRIRNFRYSFHT